jgi:dihydrofolate synthase/folylpolyglutamate synthase
LRTCVNQLLFYKAIDSSGTYAQRVQWSDRKQLPNSHTLMPIKLLSYEVALDYLYSFHRPALPADPRGPIAQALLHRLGVRQTQQSRRVGHITGTNGKGSTCTYLELYLRSAGHHTVALTSPHNNSVRERIRLNGDSISKQLFVELLEEASPALEFGRGTHLHPAPTTIIAMLAVILQEKLGCDTYGIYEVGSGGTHDSTNVFESAVVGLTRVGEDHVDQFGGSIESVLLEKLGLCRSGGNLVHQQQNESLVGLLATHCERHHISRSGVTKFDVEQVGSLLAASLLPGPWQAENAALAYRMLMLLAPDFGGLSQLRQCVNGQRAVHPGRLERRAVGNRTVLLDGAHNSPAFRCLLDYLATEHGFKQGNLTAILGFATSKRWTELIDQASASGLFSTFVFSRSTRPRGVDPSVLAAYARSVSAVEVLEAPSLRPALEWTLERAHSPIIVFGSLLLVGDFDKALHGLGLHQWAVHPDNIDPPQPWMHSL